MSAPATPPDKREFYCPHCHGKIVIPANLPPTTAPCPHCGQSITSPDFGALSQQASYAAPTPQPTQQAPVLSSPRDLDSPPASPGSRSSQKSIAPIILASVLLLAVAAGALFLAKGFLKEYKPEVPETVTAKTNDTPEVRESIYLNTGWVDDAQKVLGQFLEARDVEGKLPYILGGESRKSDLDDFYGGTEIMDSDTPASAFSPFKLSLEDREKGFFLMTYDQPAQLSMRNFFRPLAPLEVQYGIEEPGVLLMSLAKVSNFTMEPIKVMAFFKKTPEGLKLDWDTYAQTKYRTLLTFIDLPEADQKGVFRVIVSEDVPTKRTPTAGTRTYRVSDPANPAATTLTEVKVDSDIGRELSVLNWRNMAEEPVKPITRTATVELSWVGPPDLPQLRISRFICWEFLGLGGKEGNAFK